MADSNVNLGQNCFQRSNYVEFITIDSWQVYILDYTEIPSNQHQTWYNMVHDLRQQGT